MNTLYQGDNLTILRALPDASVDLIATDPPFNTGRHWGAFSDKWEGGLKGYLKFMEPRLIECRRVLKDTGSLYLHCDPTASHYLKVMLDTVFGIKQFRNEIVWCYTNPSNPRLKGFPKRHDAIFRYTASDIFIWNTQYIPYKKPFTRLRQDWGNQDKEAIWGYNKRGKPLEDFWLDIPSGGQVSPKQRTGYPTQKPVALYQRMIKASSNQGDTVLDPFAGSGTTLDAAQSLGRQWIGIDAGETAIETIQDRLRQRHGLEYNRDYELHIGID